MVDAAPLASGRDADVFAIDAGRVLRRYRRGGDVAAEATVMRYVAGLGFPVPTVHHAQGADLVMDRVDGPTMAAALIAGTLGIPDAATQLADLHHRLHELPPRLSTNPAVRVLHMDLHPQNVLLGSAGPVLIDWRNTREGPPDVDVAMSAVILAQVAVDQRHPWAGPAHALLAAFLRQVGGSPVRVLDRAVAIRTADPGLTPDEVARLGEAATLITHGG
jgi:aminoglycoside phosphotransferase (APT) family kinase protein